MKGETGRLAPGTRVATKAPPQFQARLEKEAFSLATTAVRGLPASARTAMIESQLMPCGVVEPRLVAALHAVRRELFVAQGRESLAYVDADQPLGGGRFMASPLTLGRMLQLAEAQAGERVLLVGAATGYAAAILGDMGCRVVALEEDAGLAARARRLTADFGEVEVVEGPLAEGAPSHAPFDLIIIEGAVGHVPDALVEQLSPEGRMVLVLAGQDRVHRLASGVRSSSGLSYDLVAEAPAPVLDAFRTSPAFQF